MIIDRVILTNFGQHASIDFETHGHSLVGVVGENGSGKTTFLTALRFALTSDLPEGDAASFMRDGGVHGATEVEVHFHTAACRGVITRRITKSTQTRSLKIEGEPELKSAKEVNARMSAVLGADRRAAMECVFVPQGEIQDILFNEQSVKEKLLQRMLGCAHLENVSRVFKDQASLMSGTLVDVSGQLASIRELRGSTHAEFERIKAQLPAPCKPRLDEVNNTISKLIRQAEATAAFDSRLRQLLSDYPALQPVVAPYSENRHGIVNALCQVRSQCEALSQQTAQRIATQKSQLQNLEADQVRRQQVIADCETLYNIAMPRLQQAQTSLAACPDKAHEYEETRKRYANIHASVKVANDRIAAARSYALTLQAATQAEAEARAAMDVAKEASTAAEEALAAYTAANKDLFDSDVAMEADMKATLRALQALKTSVHGTLTKCPLCESNTEHLDQVHLQERIAATEASVNTLTARMQSYRSTLFELQQQASKTRQEMENASVKLRIAEANLAALRNNPDATDVQALQESVNSMQHELAVTTETGVLLKQHQDRRTALELEVSAAQAEVSQLITRIDQGPAPDLVLMRGMFQEASHAITHLRQKLSEDENANVRDTGALAVLVSTINATSQNMASLSEAVEGNLDMLTSERAQLEAQHSLYVSTAQTLDNITQQLTKLDVEINKLEEIQRRNAAQVTLKNQLELMADLTSRSGVLRDYMRDKFRQVMTRTQTHLNRMGSDFCVAPGDTPMSFQFMRTNREVAVWLDHTKMSGAQRVITGVAFLMALQQTVIPEVGLLVLDEPSTHCSAAKQEGLRDMLLRAEHFMQADSAQIWVCDHSPSVVSAVQTKLTLGQ